MGFKRLFFVTLLNLWIMFSAFGQETFEISIGGEQEEFAYQVMSMDDGSFAVLGRTRSYGAGGHDVIIFNVRNNGQINWVTTIGTEKRDVARHFIRTEDGGYLIGAWKGTGGTVDDWHVIKMNSEGDVLWDRFVGGEYDDELQDLIYKKGNYYLVGSTINYGNGYAHIYLSKMNTEGSFQWFTIFSGGLHEHCKIIRETTDDNLILGVFSKSFGNNSFSFMLIKTNLQGVIEWSKAYLTSGDDIYRDMIVTEDGGFLSVGFTNSFGAGGYDFYLLKTDNNGNILWAKTYGGSNDDMATNIKKLADGNYIVCGETKSFGEGNGDVLIIKVTPNGDMIWSKTYGGKEEEHYASLDILTNGGFIIASQTDSYGEGKDILLIKTDSDGNSCCSKDLEGVIENVVAVDEQVVELNVLSGSEFPAWNITTTNPDVNSTLVCIDSLKIIGDTILCGNNQGIHYTINPRFDGGFEWIVPNDAVIASGQGTNEITVDFGNSDGYVYVLLNNDCSNGIIDSLFVDINQVFNVDLGSDTIFCEGNQIMLTPGNNYQSYLWQDGTTDSIYSASQSGTYWVTVTDTSGCKATDSITVETYPAFDFNLGNDTTICDGVYTFLFAPQGYESYLWQDGSDFTSYIADTAGIYWLEVTDTNSCVARDSLKLTVNKVEGFLGPDTSMCEAGSFTLRTNPKYESYFWFDGSNDSVYRVSEKGKYWVTVIDSIGCMGTDTLNLDYFPALTLTLNSTGYLCDDDSVLLEAVSNFNNYWWQDGSQNSTFIAKDSGTYWVRVTNPCETKSDTIVLDACSSIWISNVFTPNNDGYNDYFYAIGKNIPKFKMEIFNRWGQTLKVLYSLNEKWDGTYRGHKAAEGTYFWVADYEQVNWDGSIHHIRQRGSVTLLR